jgi:hypothetical protein
MTFGLFFNPDMARPRRTARAGLCQVLSRIFTLSARPLTISPFFGQSRVLGYVDVLSVEVLHALRRHHSALWIVPRASANAMRVLMPLSPPRIIVLRYARHWVELAALASAAQCASASPRHCPYTT